MNDTELKIFIGLHRVGNEIDRRTARIVKRYGLSIGQFAVLEALLHKGDLTVGEVQEKILSSTGTIPVIIKNLEQKGLVTRCPDEADRRRCILHLTESGRALAEQVFPENAEEIRKSMDVWSDDEKKELLRLLKRFGGRNGKESDS